MRVTAETFDKIVRRALARLPEEIRSHLNNIVVSVLMRPSRAMRKEAGLVPGDKLLGLFRGVSLIERSVASPPLYPDAIFLFQRPLEETAGAIEELERQIEITVVHEVAHYIGMDEKRLAELGYG
jgi:predicted Zn-dependent protease with MMP-like domain